MTFNRFVSPFQTNEKDYNKDKERSGWRHDNSQRNFLTGTLLSIVFKEVSGGELLNNPDSKNIVLRSVLLLLSRIGIERYNRGMNSMEVGATGKDVGERERMGMTKLKRAEKGGGRR